MKGTFNPARASNSNQPQSDATSFTSSLFSKCFFWMETPDPNAPQTNDPAFSFEDRATSEDESGDEEEEEEVKEEEKKRMSSLSGRNSHSTSIKIP